MSVVNIVVDTKEKTLMVVMDGQPLMGISGFSCYSWENEDGKKDMSLSISQREELDGVTKTIDYYFREPEVASDSPSYSNLTPSTEGAISQILKVLPVFPQCK